jgi:SNF family Na+-dependent transporter
MAGFAVFAILGHLARVDGRSFEDEDFNNQLAGFQLSFVTFPVAISIMPGSHFWAFLFFIMILSLGLDSAMNLMEALISILKDYSPWIRHNVITTTGIVCSSGFLLGLTMCTPNGECGVDIES